MVRDYSVSSKPECKKYLTICITSNPPWLPPVQIPELFFKGLCDNPRAFRAMTSPSQESPQAIFTTVTVTKFVAVLRTSRLLSLFPSLYLDGWSSQNILPESQCPGYVLFDSCYVAWWFPYANCFGETSRLVQRYHCPMSDSQDLSCA